MPRTSSLLRVLVVLAALAAGVGHAADSPEPKPADISRLVRQLGSPLFAEREAAGKELVRLGEAALSALEKASRQSDDPEVAERAKRLLARIRQDIRFKARIYHFDTGATVHCVAFSPDGKTLCAAGGAQDYNVPPANREFRIWWWDLTTGKEIRRTRVAAVGQIDGLTFSPDGKYLLSADYGGQVRIWDAKTGDFVRAYEAHGSVSFVACEPKGDRAVSGGADGSLQVWNYRTGETIRTWAAHPKWSLRGAWSPDGKQIVSGGSYDYTFRLWDAANGTEVRRLEGLPASVRWVAFAPGGKTAACSTGGDGEDRVGGTVHLWNVTTGKEIRRIQASPRWVEGIAFTPDGKRLLTAGIGADDKFVRLWDVAGGKELARFDHHEAPPWCVAVSPDGRRAASGSHDNSVSVFKLPE